MKKITASVLAVAVLSVIAVVLAARWGWLTASDVSLRARYALPNSRFIDIDGEPIHYEDEGRGIAIVLLHGSFGSLRMWNDWAAALVPHYRVMRFDIPPMGLSGPSPSGHYDTAHEMRLIDQLTATLGIKRFILVATSSAGIAGAAYAAENPQRVAGLILSNIAVGSFRIHRARLSALFKAVLFIDPLFGGWHPQQLWRQVLIANVTNAATVTPFLVREWTDLNNRAQRMPVRDAISMIDMMARTPEDLPRITAPTLLLWSADDQELPVIPIARTALQLLGTADKSLISVPHCGHIQPLDCGAASVVLARPFIDRIAAREPAP